MRKATGSYRTYSSLVKLQLWFLSLWWKICLRQNSSLGSCACREVPALGQNTLMMMMMNMFLSLIFHKIKSVALQLRRVKATETVAVRWQYMAPWCLTSCYHSTLISVFLIRFRYFLYQIATQYCPHEADWTAFKTLYP